MVDGRTVGEIVPNSQSAREVRDLWIYIQDKLSRIVHDPRLLPDVRPTHLAISSLLPAYSMNDESLTADAAEVAPKPLTPKSSTAGYNGPERRANLERRGAGHEPRLGGQERRVNTFGRRRSDELSDFGNTES